MNVKGNHPLGEILAAKLFSIETVPQKKQRRMVSRAIKSAIAWHEAEINRPCNQVNALDNLKPAVLEGVAYSMEYVDAETVVFTRCRYHRH